MFVSVCFVLFLHFHMLVAMNYLALYFLSLLLFPLSLFSFPLLFSPYISFFSFLTLSKFNHFFSFFPSLFLFLFFFIFSSFSLFFFLSFPLPFSLFPFPSFYFSNALFLTFLHNPDEKHIYFLLGLIRPSWCLCAFFMFVPNSVKPIKKTAHITARGCK